MTEPVILIVDDDAVLLESIADLLLLSDFEVLTASNGAEALQILQRQRPDCIISDVMMPELDGYGLLEAIRNNDRWSTIPVILITAYDKPYAKRGRHTLAPDAVLSKPFDVDQLITVIRDSLS
ncbi:MAG: response regulator [Chloroflexota bacterium]